MRPAPRSFALALATLALILAPGRAARAAAPPPVRGANGMVVTARPEATAAGLAMLKAGGNAVDAAVAATFALAVCEPYSSGLGGGGFLVLHQKLKGTTTTLDFREMAPLKASRDMYLVHGKYVPHLSRDGWGSVAVPGEVAGLLHALAKWGTLPRAQVMAPAIALAKAGFRVTSRYREVAAWRLALLRKDPPAARIFLVPGPDGGPPQVPPLGHRVVQPELARTLEAIARDGARAFYAGPVAAAIARGSAAGGGVLSADDLAAYRPTERRPIVAHYRGLTIESMPPPSSGGIALAEALHILSRFDLDRDGWHSVRSLHLLIETLRRVFADRNTDLGDPAFVDDPVARLTSMAYADRLRAGIDPLHATPSRDLPQHLAPERDPSPDTTHLSVVDAAGNAVALTTTINYGFGAGVVAPGTGVLMNDEMDDFASAPGQPNVYGLVQGEANAIAPRKVPLSSMSPTLVFRGTGKDARLYLALGAPGGPTIITTVLQVLLNVVDFHMDLSQAVAAPRIHEQWLPDQTFYEPRGLDPATVRGLEALGHHLVRRRPWGNAACILVDPKTRVRYGAADPRGEGVAAGF